MPPLIHLVQVAKCSFHIYMQWVIAFQVRCNFALQVFRKLNPLTLMFSWLVCITSEFSVSKKELLWRWPLSMLFSFSLAWERWSHSSLKHSSCLIKPVNRSSFPKIWWPSLSRPLHGTPWLSRPFWNKRRYLSWPLTAHRLHQDKGWDHIDFIYSTSARWKATVWLYLTLQSPILSSTAETQNVVLSWVWIFLLISGRQNHHYSFEHWFNRRPKLHCFTSYTTYKRLLILKVSRGIRTLILSCWTVPMKSSSLQKTLTSERWEICG